MRYGNTTKIMNEGQKEERNLTNREENMVSLPKKRTMLSAFG